MINDQPHIDYDWDKKMAAYEDYLAKKSCKKSDDEVNEMLGGFGFNNPLSHSEELPKEINL